MAVYSVTDKSNNNVLGVIKAKSPASALNHLIGETYEVKAVNVDDLTTLIEAGHKIQDAMPIAKTEGEEHV